MNFICHPPQIYVWYTYGCFNKTINDTKFKIKFSLSLSLSLALFVCLSLAHFRLSLCVIVYKYTQTHTLRMCVFVLVLCVAIARSGSCAILILLLLLFFYFESFYFVVFRFRSRLVSSGGVTPLTYPHCCQHFSNVTAYQHSTRPLCSCMYTGYLWLTFKSHRRPGDETNERGDLWSQRVNEQANERERQRWIAFWWSSSSSNIFYC